MEGAQEPQGDATGGPEPTKPKRFDWNRPMVVGVVGAIIAAGGAIAAAVITSSSSAPTPTSSGSRLVSHVSLPSVDSVTFRRADGALVIAVAGSAGELPAGYAVYAVAKSAGAAAKSAGAAAKATQSSATPWFASTGTQPDTQGRWTAQIVINPAVTSALTIQAAEMQEPPLCTTCASAQGDPLQSTLEESGPQAAHGRVSSPVTATPPR